MQGAGNGSCSESQDVDQLAQLLQLLLVLDAESLLLVDDHEPQLLEGDVLREEAVGADENVDLPFPGAGEDVLRLLRTLEAAHHLHRDRVIGEALGKGPMVLRREDRRRHQHGDLLLVFHRLECRPQRHFRLAVTDVAADQPVHRLRLLHVGEHVLDGLGLIGSLLELEVRLELPVHAVRRGKGVPGMGGARGVDVEELRRHLEQLLLHLRLALLEGLALERVELGLGRISADVFLDLPEPPDRHVEAVLAGELQQDEVGGEAAHVEPREPVVAGDSVLDVDDEIALLQVLEVGGVLAKGLRTLGRTARLGARTEHVLVGVDGDPLALVEEARAHLADDEMRVGRGIP